MRSGRRGDARMTAQIPDTIRIAERVFCIARTQGEGLFHPQSIGITPVSFSTACWRGFECDYGIEDDRLVLRRLVVPISAGQVKLGRVEIFGKLPKPVRPKHLPSHEKLFGIGMAMHEISDISVPIQFTGRLLVGQDLDTSLYVHIGLQSAYKYRQVRELIFDSGTLTAILDRSAEAEIIRATLISTSGEAEDHIDRSLKFTTKDLEFTGLPA